MIIIMKPDAKEHEINEVSEKITQLGYQARRINGEIRTVVAAVGDKEKEPLKALQFLDGVDQVMPIRQPYKLASRSTKEEDTIVNVNGHLIGEGHFTIFAGPCSVESKEQCSQTAQKIRELGGHIFRGGAYKPRTSPYSFQGLEEEGLKILAGVRESTTLPIITELIEPGNCDLVCHYTDIIQIGARNMQNFPLLKAVGKTNTPVFLKRGLSATLDDLLMSAEYILSEGNDNVILCERGIRTFETAYRNVLDLNAVPKLKSLTHLPVIVDPSHGTGNRQMVTALTKAAVAVGADGVMVEVHPNPDLAWSDGAQSLTFDMYADLIQEVKPFIKLSGKVFS